MIFLFLAFFGASLNLGASEALPEDPQNCAKVLTVRCEPIRTSNEENPHSIASAGTRLCADDTVKTGLNAKLRFILPSKVEVVVGTDSLVRVLSSASGLYVSLERGRLHIHSAKGQEFSTKTRQGIFRLNEGLAYIKDAEGDFSIAVAKGSGGLEGQKSLEKMQMLEFENGKMQILKLKHRELKKLTEFFAMPSPKKKDPDLCEGS